MWNEHERKILTVVTSGKAHKLDPMPLVRRYREESRKMGREIFAEAVKTVLEGEETDAMAKTVLPIMYRVLDWKPFSEDSENGYLESEVLEAFTQFLEWLVDLKKKEENSPSSAGQAGGSEETQATASIAVSSSAEASSKAEEPGSLPSVAV
ncbi:MAG TPA: hypothetical protein PLN21_09430 [Gemmatales bacterium]|nr:hypothetical protein [Gemmatales bacterium]